MIVCSARSNLGPAVLERFAQSVAIPVLGGLEAGHGPGQRPVFLHTRAELRCGADPQLSVHSAAFAPR